MRGILFKPDIWKAKLKVLEQYGEAQTRRLFKLKGLNKLKGINEYPDEWIFIGFSNDGEYWFQHPQCERYHYLYNAYPKPHYQAGDVLYIKEAWATEKQYNHLKPSLIPRIAKIHYVNDGVGEWPLNLAIGKWRSPMFMPAWAARLFCRIIEVSCERLRLPLTANELEREGGEEALTILEKINGLWVWVYWFALVDKGGLIK